MAKKQTRRTVSFNRAVFVAITKAAAKAGLTASHFVEQCVRAKIKLPKTTHVSPATARKATKGTAQIAKLEREIAALKRAWKVKPRRKAKAKYPTPLVEVVEHMPVAPDELLQPPIIDRDPKPSNMIRGNGAQSIPELTESLRIMREVG
jgi:outer membrane receptor for monomeric catechols